MNKRLRSKEISVLSMEIFNATRLAKTMKVSGNLEEAKRLTEKVVRLHTRREKLYGSK